MIHLNNIHHQFDSRAIAGLNGINLKLKKDEITFLIGPNGSGKTTLLKVLTGALIPKQGTVESKLKITTLTEIESRHEDMSIYTYLDEQSKHQIQNEDERHHEIRESILWLELTNQIHQPIKHLSAGQRQRVRLACAIMLHADYLLLDEPFSHLDHRLRLELYKMFIDLMKSQKMGSLWVCHEMQDTYQFAERIILINYGKIIQDCSPQVLYQKPNSLFSAEFSGAVNALVATVTQKENNILHVQTSIGKMHIECKQNDVLSQPIGNEVLLLIRPEQFELSQNSHDFTFTPKHNYFYGHTTRYEGAIEQHPMVIEIDANLLINKDKAVKVKINHQKTWILKEI
jgi:iron(III) transport system ATP-binding protein